MAKLNVDSVSCKEAYGLAKQCVKMRTIPFFFHGRPGIGKSELVAQIAAELGMELEVLMLTQIDAQDLRGIQYPDAASKRMVYYPPEFLPGDGSPPTILFLDELTGAEPRLQVSAYQLLLSRRIGSYHLPDNCYVCAAGNGPADGAIAYEMGTALSSRLLHIPLMAEPNSWLEWAAINSIHASVMTLIQIKGDLLEQTDQQLDNDHLVGPNPRAWARVSEVVTSVGIDNRGKAEPLVSGLVGRAAAAELFLTHDELSGLPTPAEILAMDEKKFERALPSTIASMYGLTYSLVSYASDLDTMKKALSFLNIMDEKGNEGLPCGECMSLGVELLLEKSTKMGVEDDLAVSEEYDKIAPKISELYQVSQTKVGG